MERKTVMEVYREVLQMGNDLEAIAKEEDRKWEKETRDKAMAKSRLCFYIASLLEATEEINP